MAEFRLVAGTSHGLHCVFRGLLQAGSGDSCMPAIMLDVGALLIRVCRMLDRLCWLHMDVPNVTGHAQAGLKICTVVLVDRESPNPTQPLETQLGSWQSRLARRADVPRKCCAQRRPAPAHSVSRLTRITFASAGISSWTVAACTFRYSSAQAAGPRAPSEGVPH